MFFIYSEFNFVSINIEWWHYFLPDWVVFREGVDGENLTQLYNVGDLEFFKLEVRIEHPIMELSKLSQGISFRQVLLLTVINSNFIKDFWSIIASFGLRDSLEIIVIRCSAKSVLEIFVVFAVVKGFVTTGSTWV